MASVYPTVSVAREMASPKYPSPGTNFARPGKPEEDALAKSVVTAFFAIPSENWTSYRSESSEVDLI